MDIYSNYKKYLNFVNNCNDNIKDIHGDEYSGSFYAYYIHKKCNLPIDENYEPIYTEKIDDIYKLQNFNFDLDGIYSFMSETSTDMINFIIIINGNNLDYSCIYGEQQYIITLNENKNIWIQLLKKLYLLNNVNENKIELYKKIYGITTVYFDNLNLDNFCLHYSYKKL